MILLLIIMLTLDSQSRKVLLVHVVYAWRYFPGECPYPFALENLAAMAEAAEVVGK